MLNRIDICKGCLRTDRILKRIDPRVTNFHEELCDFSYTSHSVDLKFCVQCEYLLKKLYKFKQKCVKAINILQKWKKKSVKKPLKSLYTLLPRSSLGIWTANNTKTFNFQEEPRPKDSVLQLKSEPEEISISPEDIQLEDCKDGLQVLTVQNESKHDNDHSYAVNYDDIKLVKCLDDSVPIGNYDTDIDNILDDSVWNSDNTETDCSLNSDDIHEEDKDPEESSIDGDNDNKTGIKKDNLGTESNMITKLIAHIENMNAEYVPTNNESKKIVTQAGNAVQTKKVASVPRKVKKAPLTLKERKKINKCRNRIGDEHTVAEISTAEATKRALIENIKAKFENCAELKLESGVLIDKEHILNCLDGKVTEYTAKWLWKNVKGKKLFSPKAIKILGLIQNQYDTRKYESVFEIEYLNSTEAKKEGFQRRQTYPWYLESKHKCEICYTVFRFEKHLEKHINMCHHDESGKFICPICGVRNNTKKAHKHHLYCHDAVYKCKLCPLVTFHKGNMKHHYDQHMGVKYTCEPCDRIFPSLSAYYTHRAYRHGTPRECTACGAAFRTPEALDAHRTHCKSEPPTDGSTSVKCDKCELSFPSQQVHERHYRRAHGDGFYKMPVRTTHARKESNKAVKTGEVRKVGHSCPVCHAVGTTYGWLVLHGRKEHNEDFDEMYADKRKHLCDVCGKGYSSKYSLRDHLNTHTGERPFACDKCPKRFYSSNKLGNHQHFHSPPTFVCEQCGKKFHTQSNLWRHAQGHTGNRRYKCDICDKAFVYSCALNEHIRGVHNKMRRERKRGVTEEVGKGVTEEVGNGATEEVWKRSTITKTAITFTTTIAKRRKVRKVSSTDESSDSD